MILAALRVLICFVVYGVNLVEVNLVIIRSPHLMCREQPALVENIVIFQNDSEKLPCFCYVMREVFCSYGREFKVHNVHPNVGGADGALNANIYYTQSPSDNSYDVHCWGMPSIFDCHPNAVQTLDGMSSVIEDKPGDIDINVFELNATKIGPRLRFTYFASNNVSLARFVQRHPNVDDPDDTEEDTRAGDRQHGESGIRHILLGLEVILGIFINVSGAIGGSRATRNPREMNLTHVTWWLIYIWFGSFCVVFAIGLTILG